MGGLIRTKLLSSETFSFQGADKLTRRKSSQNTPRGSFHPSIGLDYGDKVKERINMAFVNIPEWKKETITKT